MPSTNPSYKEIRPAEWINRVIAEGIEKGASDVHIEPFLNRFVIRYRINGILYTVEEMPIAYLETITSHLKVLSQLNITERRMPQDGHLLFYPKGTVTKEPMDLRISIFPTVYGEAVVMRIQNRKDLLFESLEKLGIDKSTAERMRLLLERPSGMILVTGLGGSGKTTTLYTILNYFLSQKIERNILTLEDPVELYLPGIRQAQIRPDIGFTFAMGLRSILRQDPNVVMVGEIRDEETAEISIRAALMGALFFSTMHTINSVGAITRLLEFGSSPSLVASALLCIVSQRLMRILCENCKEEDRPTQKLRHLTGISPDDNSIFYKGKGCKECNGTGYKGRTGIFEVMFIDRKIHELILKRATFIEIEKQAKEDGMETLQEIAIRKAKEGITSLEEVLRVIPFFNP